MSYKGDQETDTVEEAEDTGYGTYRRQCWERGNDTLDWGGWLAARMPIYDEETPERIAEIRAINEARNQT